MTPIGDKEQTVAIWNNPRDYFRRWNREGAEIKQERRARRQFRRQFRRNPNPRQAARIAVQNQQDFQKWQRDFQGSAYFTNAARHLAQNSPVPPPVPSGFQENSVAQAAQPDNRAALTYLRLAWATIEAQGGSGGTVAANYFKRAWENASADLRTDWEDPASLELGDKRYQLASSGAFAHRGALARNATTPPDPAELAQALTGQRNASQHQSGPVVNVRFGTRYIDLVQFLTDGIEDPSIRDQRQAALRNTWSKLQVDAGDVDRANVGTPINVGDNGDIQIENLGNPHGRIRIDNKERLEEIVLATLTNSNLGLLTPKPNLLDRYLPPSAWAIEAYTTYQTDPDACAQFMQDQADAWPANRVYVNEMVNKLQGNLNTNGNIQLDNTQANSVARVELNESLPQSIPRNSAQFGSAVQKRTEELERDGIPPNKATRAAKAILTIESEEQNQRDQTRRSKLENHLRKIFDPDTVKAIENRHEELVRLAADGKGLKNASKETQEAVAHIRKTVVKDESLRMALPEL